MADSAAQHIEKQEEHLDVLTKSGRKTGISKPRGDVHRDGDYHRAVHVWIFAESTQELLLQRRADCKDSWAGLWDISSAGHIAAGDSSLITARRELEEELGVTLPKDAFELIFVFLQECVINDGKYINNEYNDVYLVTTLDPIPLEAFTLQETEVSAVKYISYEEYKQLLAKEDSDYVPYDVYGQYGQLFDIIDMRYKDNSVARSLSLQKQLRRYAPNSLSAELAGLSESDKEALVFIVKAAAVMDELFYLQAWYSNPVLRDWLKKHADGSELDKLKYSYYQINKSPWSSLDEDQAFLTTADSAIRLLPDATKPVKNWKGLEYRAAFPVQKPPGANFYPPDMDKMEFELWKDSLEKDQQTEAISFFSVIKRHSEFLLDSNTTDNKVGAAHDLYIVPYSQEYKSLLAKAAELLHKAGNITSSPSLKRLLHSKADAFLSNDYYDSDIAWIELDSKLDVTIGPYETYEDKLFGYKATFEAFIGVRDDQATAQLKLFGDNLQVLEQNLPMDSVYKSEDVNAAPIRVIQLIYNAGELQEFHSALEEAKADIVGLWALRFFIYKDLLSKSLLKSMYVSFLAGCFRSVRFGLKEAHGKGQALQFNWLFEKGAFILHSDDTFSVDFSKIEGAVESLSREILTIQAKGDKEAAGLLLNKYGVLTEPLKVSLNKLELVQVPVDIAPSFPIAEKILQS
ncbi:nudix hydrolase 3-like isoform X2 [Prosopis cineraria]|uniref:nudix hydrolase 3-like isoform X2 n=1 Tax=Prosopis cineraria TaxID=364024 RepID=UPI00240EA268|nr:nudix hydrolase 3-like isoform X2 [Prosopis cineraria]